MSKPVYSQLQTPKHHLFSLHLALKYKLKNKLAPPKRKRSKRARPLIQLFHKLSFNRNLPAWCCCCWSRHDRLPRVEVAPLTLLLEERLLGCPKSAQQLTPMNSHTLVMLLFQFTWIFRDDDNNDDDDVGGFFLCWLWINSITFPEYNQRVKLDEPIRFITSESNTAGSAGVRRVHYGLSHFSSLSTTTSWSAVTENI